MISYWTMRGYSDPEGQFESGEIVCAIEQSEDGCRLLLEHNGEIQLHGRIPPTSANVPKHERPIFSKENRPIFLISGRGDWI